MSSLTTSVLKLSNRELWKKVQSRQERAKRSKDADDASLQLFTSGAFSDVTIKCKDQSWKCHKNILVSRCEFFAACLRNECLESSTNTITLDGDDVSAVERMLRYIYSYNITSKDIIGYTPSESYNVMKAADKYGLEQLESACLTAIVDRIGEVHLGSKARVKIVIAELLDLIIQLYTEEPELSVSAALQKRVVLALAGEHGWVSTPSGKEFLQRDLPSKMSSDLLREVLQRMGQQEKKLARQNRGYGFM